jgi:hypothetical protein
MRYSIRDLLYITAIAGLCIGWWLDHRQQEAKVTTVLNAHREAVGVFQSLVKFMEREGYRVDWNKEDHILTTLRPGEH